MQNEHCTDGRTITAEDVRKYMRAYADSSELVWLADKDDEVSQALLREHGFRYSGKRNVDGNIFVVYKWFRDQAGLYEDMDVFFNRRVEDYDLHMEDLNSGYKVSFTSLFNDLPQTDEEVKILDLGAGTGAELRYIFGKAPNAKITCVDVAGQMLMKLRERYPEFDTNIETVCGSYLDTDFGTGRFDYTVACSTLHHLLAEDKARVYVNLRRWLKDGGCLLMQEFVATGEEEENECRTQYLNLVADGTIDKNRIYHIDIPLTAEHEEALLSAAGFTCTRIERKGESGVLITAVAA